MDQRVKKLWIDALRSGEYQKGTHQLRSADNKFCCLGVLCNVHAQEHPELAEGEQDTTSYLGAEKILPREVALWAGLSLTSPIVRFKKEQRRIASVNDTTDLSLAEIADIVEAQL